MLIHAQFELIHLAVGHNVGVLSQELPPPEEVTVHKRYHYNPCPLDQPLLPELFLHALTKPECYPSNILQSRVPKKLNVGILGPLSSASNPIGWGVHVIEGPHWVNIAIYCLVSAILSVVATILWAALKRDEQGARGSGNISWACR